MLVKVDDLGVLLKPEHDIEVGRLATVERDGFLDVVGDAGTLLGTLENDAHREGTLADYRLIGAGDGDEIRELHDVSLRRRTAFADDHRVERDFHRATAVLAFEVGLAEEAVKRDIVRAALRGGSED